MDVKKDMNLRFDRRSEQMPVRAREVKYHPTSVSGFDVVLNFYGCMNKIFTNILNLH